MMYEPLGKFVALSQGLAVNKGTAHLFSNTKTEEFVYPLLRIVDLEKGNHTSFSKYVTRNIQKTVIISEDTIVFSRVTCQCFRGFSGVVHNNLFIVNLVNEDLDKDYLFTVLQSDFVKRQALKLSQSSVVPDLTHDMFKSIIIPVPDKNTQRRIATTYLTIAAKTSINNKICDELESMAKTIYDYWFTQFDFPDADGKPYRSSGGAMEWNERLKGNIPKSWGITCIGEVTQNHDSKRIPLSQNERDSMKGDIPYYGATGIMDYVNRPLFDGQYVLIAEDGSVMDAKGNPIVQMIWGKTWVNNHAHVLEGCNGYSNELLYLLLRHIPVVKIMTGSIQKKINQDNLNGYRIPRIPDSIARAFSELVEPMFEKVRVLQKENDELTKLRDWLLPMLMNGQATVADAEDEPAKVIPFVSKSDTDQRFATWLQNQGIAARGDVDMQTMREIFDAMDDDDK